MGGHRARAFLEESKKSHGGEIAGNHMEGRMWTGGCISVCKMPGAMGRRVNKENQSSTTKRVRK